MPENLLEENQIPKNPPDSFQETSQIIEQEPWQREIDGMYRAMQFIHLKAKTGENGFGREDLITLQKIVINDPFNPQKKGSLREVPVVSIEYIIGGQRRETAALPPDPHFLSEYFNEFSSELGDKTQDISASSSVEEVIELASWAHHRLIEIHPFVDGNGRTARLLVDFIFRKARLPYIKDWGAQEDEYKDVIYRSLKETNLDLFRLFLARKLLSRLRTLKGLNRVDNQELKDYIQSRIQETNVYVKSFGQQDDS